MNALRRFLQRGGMVGRVSCLAAFAVLFARALLPGAVMLDPVSAAQGEFALVICSGHGPMFASDPSASAMDAMAADPADPTADEAHDDMDMSGMPGMAGAPAHDSMTSDDGLCPFSAALVVACVGAILAVLFLALTRATQSWDALSARPPARPSPHSRPFSRAPPLFS